jgi:hypothetical protein
VAVCKECLPPRTKELSRTCYEQASAPPKVRVEEKKRKRREEESTEEIRREH